LSVTTPARSNGFATEARASGAAPAPPPSESPSTGSGKCAEHVDQFRDVGDADEPLRDVGHDLLACERCAAAP